MGYGNNLSSSFFCGAVVEPDGPGVTFPPADVEKTGMVKTVNKQKKEKKRLDKGFMAFDSRSVS